MSFYDLPITFYPTREFLESLYPEETVFSVYKLPARFATIESVAPNPHDLDPETTVFPKASLALTDDDTEIIESATFVEDVEVDNLFEGIEFPHISISPDSRFLTPKSLLITATTPETHTTHLPVSNPSIFQVIDIADRLAATGHATPEGLYSFVVNTLNPVLDENSDDDDDDDEDEDEDEDDWVLHFAYLGETELELHQHNTREVEPDLIDLTKLCWFEDTDILWDKELEISNVKPTVSGQIKLSNLKTNIYGNPRFLDNRFDLLYHILDSELTAYPVIDTNYLTVYCHLLFTSADLFSDNWEAIAAQVDNLFETEIEYDSLFITKNDSVYFVAKLPDKVTEVLIDFLLNSWIAFISITSKN